MHAVPLATKGVISRYPCGSDYTGDVTQLSGPIVRREDEFIKPKIVVNKLEIEDDKGNQISIENKVKVKSLKILVE